jgi:hypothetical protein
MATLQQIAAIVVFASALVASLSVIATSLASPRVRVVLDALRRQGGW